MHAVRRPAPRRPNRLHRQPSDRGFALPWVLLVLVLVSLLATTGFLMTWLDGLAARAFSRATDAFYVAEGGLETAIATAAGRSPALAPVALGGGSATIRFERLLDLGPGETLFRVSSLGSVVSAGATFEREVGRLLWVADPPRAPGALVAVGGVAAISPTGRISGFDTSGGGCVAHPSPVAGIAYWGGPAPASTASFAVTGFPVTRSIPNATSVAYETGIRWFELIAPFGPDPDATVPPDPWPAAGAAGGWPHIRLPGSVSLAAGRSGQGTLVVEGDLDLGPGFTWRGLILVGGTLRLTGGVTIRGAAFGGLAGGVATAVDLGSQQIDLELDACAVTAAAARLTAPAAAVPGTWYEAW